MQRLEDLIGKRVLVAMANTKAAGHSVILHGTEVGGIWIECEEYERLLGYKTKKSTRPKKLPTAKPVFFIPFAQIVFLVSFSTELDEETLRGS